MQNEGALFTIGKASEYLGVSIDTLRRWQKKGRLNALRSPGGHRYFSKKDLDSVFGKKYERDEPTLRQQKTEIPLDLPKEPSKRDLIPPWRKSLPTQDIAKEILIPQITPIRIIKTDAVPVTSETSPQESNPPTKSSETSDSASALPSSQSLLTPITLGEEVKKPERAKETHFEFTWKIALGAAFSIIILLAFVLFVIWKSSQNILSPVP